MKKIRHILEWGSVLIGSAGAVTTVITDRRVHVGHGEHLPCECRSTCISCLRD
jgi:hypothetical protein